MIKFKYEKDKSKLMGVHPVLVGILFGYMIPWINAMGVEPVITSTIRGKLHNSVSNSHMEGRAIDLRAKDWPVGLCEAFVINFNRKFSKSYGAPSYSDLIPRIAVCHGKGDNVHLHLQVKKGLSLMALYEDFKGE